MKIEDQIQAAKDMLDTVQSDIGKIMAANSLLERALSEMASIRDEINEKTAIEPVSTENEVSAPSNVVGTITAKKLTEEQEPEVDLMVGPALNPESTSTESVFDPAMARNSLNLINGKFYWRSSGKPVWADRNNKRHLKLMKYIYDIDDVKFAYKNGKWPEPNAFIFV